MSNKKHILVVDDHYEIQELLSSMLKVSNPDFKVTCVPSAEEGQLELRMTAYDLLITDLRLPGMSGFDLVKQVNQMRPNLPIIMISGTVDVDWVKETKDLQIVRHFIKPLNVDQVLETVDVALFGKKTTTKRSEPIAPIQLPPEVTERLETLRSDTGAVKAILARVDGQIMVSLGGSTGYDMPALIEIIAKNIGGSFQLAQQLGTDESLAIQYQSGAEFDVYSANVGNQYLVVLFFAANARRGRIGTIWIFTQRAIKDLLTLLENKSVVNATPPEPVASKSVSPSKKPATKKAATKKPTPKPRTTRPKKPTAKPKTTRSKKPTPKPTQRKEPASKIIYTAAKPVVEKPKEKEPPPPPAPVFHEATELEADELKDFLSGLGDTEGNAGISATDNLDDFWSDALSTEDINPSQGMSFEEAMKQGLISGKLGEDAN